MLRLLGISSLLTSTVKTFFAYDLLQNRSFTEELSRPTSREGHALPDSQAGIGDALD
jgi:hypothetical protein